VKIQGASGNVIISNQAQYSSVPAGSCATPTPKPTPAATAALVKTVETVQAPTPGPNSLVISRDVFIKDGHQDGEIHLTPGETFSVSLAQDEAQKRVWDEPPEITNEGVVTKVDYNTASAAEDLKIRCICGRLNLNNT